MSTYLMCLYLMSVDEQTSSSQPSHVSTPHAHSSSTSSNLLNVPGMSSSQHQRSPSFGSTGTSLWTPTPSSALASSDIGEEKSEQRNLLKQNEPEIPNNPFAFTPKQLAKLHDPKDVNVLRDMGGLEGLVFGLRTDVSNGLSNDEDHLQGKVTLQDCWHALETRRKQQMQEGISKKQEEETAKEAVAEIASKNEKHDAEDRDKAKRSDSAGSKRKSSLSSRRATLTSIRSQALPSKGFSDRKRIFSENRIPARKPKNILQLMWMALHDKILVYSFSNSD
jgi:P-type Ca2+ transporter type 2C